MEKFVIWIAIGSIIGLLGSVAMHTEAERGTMINIAVSVAGALAAALVLSPLLVTITISADNVSLLGFVMPLLGASALLVAVSGFRNLVQRYRPGV